MLMQALISLCHACYLQKGKGAKVIGYDNSKRVVDLQSDKTLQCSCSYTSDNNKAWHLSASSTLTWPEAPKLI